MMRPVDLWHQLILALVFLTRLPLGFLLPEEEVPLSRALWAFPLAGAAVGAISALPLFLPGPPLVTATLAVVLAIWLTGGLHEDGLADFTDGMGGQTRDERLAIMRDPAVGSYGTLALLGCVILRIVSIAALGPLALIGAAAAGRSAMVLAASVLPPARPDGLGRAAARVGRDQLWAAGLIGAVLLAISGPAALAGIIAGLLVTGLVIRLARDRLGGQTGDVLGTVAILTETAVLASFALCA
ncbi:adenosylcobinamide-GDP ribazoletransferase [Paracoccus tegillarcae]|uniref:Adenosylcobinamide-GDP ribazoletransferase n=1 Tax=Paracoccus tegillarcae TaxID=1529068 RepID=A0A2K9F6H6_9RHOB|nr:adenosylcobinamide-GDP ribazoletransferase [Paracoccus tegillarcae]AUH34781.1 adenosylcobinamide-GDP ribazoletransferase [Paracoccus tegillarcae]